MALWASGVAVVAVREGERVLATTVTAFMSVSVEPPLVLVALGPGAQVLPFLSDGGRLGVSVLEEGQARTARVLADAFPVGPNPFSSEGDPFVEGALVRLGARVQRTLSAGDHTLVLAAVDSASGSGGRPLLRYDRAYRTLTSG